MSTDTCTLCDLPTPDPPVTAPDVEGTFCCAGCLQVYDLLDELEPEQAERVREETIARKHREWEEDNEQVPDDHREAFLKVDGMHCTTCESFIESMSRQQEGIYKSEASYAAEIVKVYFDPARVCEADLPDLISKMGYKARPMEQLFGDDNFLDMIRLTLGVIFGAYGLITYSLLLYPLYLTGHYVIPFAPVTQYFFIANIFMMSTVMLFFTGFPILRGAWVSLRVMNPNMDLLIAIAALSAYFFSAVALFLGLNEIYFDVSMTIILVVTLGNYYESRMKKNKNSLLAELMESRISQARMRKNGSFATVSLEEVHAGDEMMVKAGERIPLDGTVTDGRGVVDESLITGESLPVSKRPGDRAISGTILTQNALTIKVNAQLESTLERMIRLMWNIQASRSGKQRLADKIAAYFVPAVLVLGVVTFLIYILGGTAVAPSLLAALAVLIVSCPCALGLATPLAVASGLRDALKNNILFKSSGVFEEKSEIDILAFDKTGTLTTGHMQLLDEGENPQALAYARALEQYALHPVAGAIAWENDSDLTVEHFESETCGVSGEINRQRIMVGLPAWLEEQGYQISSEQRQKVHEARKLGYVATAVGWDNQVQSILVVGDQMREEAVTFITEMKKQGKKIAIITGDSEEAARPIQRQLEPDFLYASVRPESKTEIIRDLRKSGSVAMIGDGSNDALALADADLGIGFGDLTAIAAESAQIVIPRGDLYAIDKAFKAMRQTKKRIRQNLGWAFLYNVTAIPLAIAGLINPLFAAIAMASSSILVVSNSSRKMKL